MCSASTTTSGFPEAWRPFVDADWRLTVWLPCEACGYNLHRAQADGRCPECGRPVGESLAADDPSVLPSEQAARIAEGVRSLAWGGVLASVWCVYATAVVVNVLLVPASAAWRLAVGSARGWVSTTVLWFVGVLLAMRGAAVLVGACDFRYRTKLRRRLIGGVILALAVSAITLAGYESARAWVPLAAGVLLSALLLPGRFLGQLLRRLAAPRWSALAAAGRWTIACSVAFWLLATAVDLLRPAPDVWIRLPGTPALYNGPAAILCAVYLASAGTATLGLCAARLLRAMGPVSAESPDRSRG